MTTNPKEYSRETVLEIIHAAYRTNGYRCISDSIVNKVGVSNRLYVLNTLAWYHGSASSADHVLTIEDEDKDWVKIAQKYIDTFVLFVMKDGEDFNKSLYSAAIQETYKITDIGILVWLPAHIEDAEMVKIIKQNNADGVFEFSDRIQNKPVFILDIKPSEMYSNFLYTGLVENKLISFYHKKKLDKHEEYVILDSKFKKTFKSKRYKNLPVTTINYVKLK